MRKVKAETSARENKSETINRFTIDNLTLSDIPTATSESNCLSRYERESENNIETSFDCESER